jgi:hypothetical protein
LAFLDEDELAPAEPGSRRFGRDPQRQYLVRRVIALGVGVLILILLLLGIRGCLNARKERGFENYVSDLTAVVNESTQLSTGFFERLDNPPKGQTELSLQSAIAADRGTAEGLLTRVESLDAPDELKDAQSELVQAFELRRDALADIADQVPTALGNQDNDAATEAIAADMKELLASDVLYARAQADIKAVLEDEGIAAKPPPADSVFIPDDRVAELLDPLELTSLLTGAVGEAEATSGVHGTELQSTTLNPGGVVLTPDSLNTVTLSGKPEIEVAVLNGGDSEETDISVSFSLSGGAETIEGETTIDKIAAGGVGTATLAIDPEPEKGTELSLEVTVAPVPGETLTDNNTSTYPITFG